ncbi:FMN-binding protein [Breznakiella homolactica]|uniref:FMN-binding protein n=1 Tax=Breznakiella homolactica TaxID=2798577 RepID=A0A7T7XMT7_9SPIR|nr:FMN-binding protein [Breznakiella homolactica]QQO09256.1 FMN-binding protein [Breznakiella homolactica]
MKRISVVLAAAVLVAALSACASSGSSAAAIYNPGSYEGVGEGYHGDIRVSVTVTAAAITGVEIVSHGDTPGIGTVAFEDLTPAVIDANSTNVDTVAGATGSSRGFLAAVENALSKARL